MYKNYEKRVKDFISDMSNPTNQIVITDVTEKIDNCRQELMNESKMQKPFIFKGYSSELDRINDTVKNNRLLYNLPDYPDKKLIKSQSKKNVEVQPIINFHVFENLKDNEDEKNKSSERGKKIPPLNLDSISKKNIQDLGMKYKRRMSITEKNKINSLIKKDSILQPQMRFTARTDLERVYDALNGDYIKNNEREIIERQLKNINLFDYKKPKELLKSSDSLRNKLINRESKSPHENKHEGIKKIYGPSNVYYEAGNNDRKIWARKDNLNLEARGLLSSYHVKTHFKATEEIAEYKSRNKRSLKHTCFLLPHLLPKNHNYQNFNTYADINNSNISKRVNKSVNNQKPFDYSKLEDTRKIFNFEEEHERDVINSDKEELDYNRLNNPLLKEEKRNVDPDSLRILSKMAFVYRINGEKEMPSIENNDVNIINEEREEEKHRKGKGDGNIEITNLNYVAKKILDECNFYSKKSKFNNSSHKAKEGKTMITQGMTIKEFENKYNFNN
mgnify:CR=1 FL=1